MYLQNEINIKNKIIEQKDLIIMDLNNKLNNINQFYNNNMSMINQLQNNLYQKEQELQQLKKKIFPNSNNQFIDDPNKKYGFAITFRSTSQDLIHPIICNENDLISRLEEEVYNQYPKYKEINTFLTCKGITLKRFKTVGENNIKKDDAIMVNIFE